MAVSVVQSAAANTATATLAATFATALTSANTGDLLIAWCSSGTATTYTTPTGWSILSPLASTSYCSSIAYYKYSTGSETGISVALSAAATSSVMVVQVTGVSSTAPTATQVTQAGSSTSITFAAQTPSVAGSAIFEFCAMNSSANTVATPTGYTAMTPAAAGYHTVNGFYLLSASTGSDGTQSTTEAAGSPWNSMSVLVTPGSGGASATGYFYRKPLLSKF